MYKEISDEERIEIIDILRSFSIKNIVTIRKNTKASVNYIYLVDTDTNKFILRKGNPKTTIKQLNFEAAVLTHLKKKNCSFSPKIIPTKDGELIVTKDGSYFSLFSFLEGSNHMKWNTRDFHIDEYASQFQFMAELHTLLLDLKQKEEQHFDVLAFLKSFPEELMQYRKIAQEKQCAFSKILLINFDMIKKACEESYNALQTYSYQNIPTQVIHGDVHFGNLLFKDNKVHGIVDFDWCSISTTFWDFAYCFSQNGTFCGENDGKLDFALFTLALQSYFGDKQISNEELSILQQLVKAGDLRAIKWEINSYYDIDQEEEYVGFLQHTLRTVIFNDYDRLGK